MEVVFDEQRFFVVLQICRPFVQQQAVGFAYKTLAERVRVRAVRQGRIGIGQHGQQDRRQVAHHRRVPHGERGLRHEGRLASRQQQRQGGLVQTVRRCLQTRLHGFHGILQTAVPAVQETPADLPEILVGRLQEFIKILLLPQFLYLFVRQAGLAV